MSTPTAAVVFHSTAATTHNTTAPSVDGTPSDGGWQWVGLWGSFIGTPIGPHHFLTANHVGGTVGQAFNYAGVAYTTVHSFKDPASDLQIWEVREVFPTWAPLYRNANESGTLLVFGRGVTRGAEVRTAAALAGVPASSLAGWYWTPQDGILRWGRNSVAGFTNHATFGPQIAATFDANGGTDECHLGTNDSSAPVFVQEGIDASSPWKLAGIAGLVESGFSLTSGGATFNAALFDKRGLYVNGTLSTGSAAKPSAFFATRVSSRIDWIDGILAQPLTASIALSDLEAVYDGAPHPATAATAPPGLATTVTYDGTATVPVHAGLYAVTATVSDPRYTGSATATLLISRATQSIDFPAPAPSMEGAATLALAANATSGLPVVFTSNNPAVATVEGDLLSIHAAGSATLTASQGGNSNFYAAADVVHTLTITAAQPPDGSDIPLLTPGGMAALAVGLLGFGIRALRRVRPTILL